MQYLLRNSCMQLMLGAENSVELKFVFGLGRIDSQVFAESGCSLSSIDVVIRAARVIT